jgi:hypothetical protein
MRPQQLGRQETLAQQALRAVEVGQDQVEQLGALRETGFERLPLARREEQRQGIELPGPVRAPRIAVHVVGDAVLAQQPPRQVPSSRQLLRPEARERIGEPGPVRARRFGARQQLVVHVGVRRQRVAEPPRRARGDG